MAPSGSFLAPAKLNLYLHITGRRADGFHLLETVFRLIDLCDTVDIQVREDGQITRSSVLEGVAPEQDLTVRAARCLQQYTHCKLGADIGVTKRIPLGGGLGGGSSDAATVLLALNQLWNLQLPNAELQKLGLTLGADVPVFILGQNARATGIGEILTPVVLNPACYVLLFPPVQCDTRKIFQEYAKKALTGDARLGIMRSLETRNDLQDTVLELYPEVKTALEKLLPYGKALMTGSGSSVFLECNSDAQAKKIASSLPGAYVTKGLSQHPMFTGKI